MAWTAPMTFTAGSPLTAAQLNANLRDNLMETAPAKASVAGGYFVTTNTNQIAERVSQTHVVDTNETTSSSSYADLATVGPTVTVTTGTMALVFFACGMSPSSTAAVRATVEVSGDTSISADDAWCIRLTGTSSTSINCGTSKLFDDLTPGTNTFTMKYLSGSGSTAFFQRRMTVLPL